MCCVWWPWPIFLSVCESGAVSSCTYIQWHTTSMEYMYSIQLFCRVLHCIVIVCTICNSIESVVWGVPRRLGVCHSVEHYWPLAWGNDIIGEILIVTFQHSSCFYWRCGRDQGDLLIVNSFYNDLWLLFDCMCVSMVTMAPISSDWASQLTFCSAVWVD